MLRKRSIIALMLIGWLLLIGQHAPASWSVQLPKNTGQQGLWAGDGLIVGADQGTACQAASNAYAYTAEGEARRITLPATIEGYTTCLRSSAVLVAGGVLYGGAYRINSFTGLWDSKLFAYQVASQRLLWAYQLPDATPSLEDIQLLHNTLYVLADSYGAWSSPAQVLVLSKAGTMQHEPYQLGAATGKLSVVNDTLAVMSVRDGEYTLWRLNAYGALDRIGSYRPNVYGEEAVSDKGLVFVELSEDRCELSMALLTFTGQLVKTAPRPLMACVAANILTIHSLPDGSVVGVLQVLNPDSRMMLFGLSFQGLWVQPLEGANPSLLTIGQLVFCITQSLAIQITRYSGNGAWLGSSDLPNTVRQSPVIYASGRLVFVADDGQGLRLMAVHV